MNKFLKKTALFMLLFLLPLFSFEWYVRHLPIDPYGAKKTFLEENLTSCETLIMGSSYSWAGLNPGWLNANAVNVANAFQPFYYDYEILKNYLPQMSSLNTVIIPASYVSFFNQPSAYHENLYSIYWGFTPYRNKSIRNYSLILSLSIKNILDRVYEEENHLVNNGWLEFDATFDGSPDEARQRLQSMHEHMDIGNWEENIMWLENIISLCKSHNVRLILFEPPYSMELNRQMEKYPYQEKIEDYLENLPDQEKVDLYNFNDNNLFVNDLFCDADHLNTRGANLLSGFFELILARP